MGRGRHRQWRKGLPKGPSPPKLGALGHDVCAPQASPPHPWEKAAETVHRSPACPTGCNSTPLHLRPYSSREMGCKYPTSQSLAQVGQEPDPVRPCKFMHKFLGGVSVQDRICEQQLQTLMLSPTHNSPLCLLGPAQQQPGGNQPLTAPQVADF